MDPSSCLLAHPSACRISCYERAAPLSTRSHLLTRPCRRLRSHHVQQVSGVSGFPGNLPPIYLFWRHERDGTQQLAVHRCLHAQNRICAEVHCCRRYVLAFSGFPYPVSLTLWHMLFCSVVSIALVKGGLVEPVEGMTFEIYKVGSPPATGMAC